MRHVLPNDVFSDILIATHMRVNLLYDLPKENKFIFVIERVNVLDFWEVLYEKLHKINITLRKDTVLDDMEFNRLLFYVQLIGGFYDANGYSTEDALYASACKYFVQHYYADRMILAEDHATIFYNAFPDSKK